jgi:DNA mismatch endonuclease (patch repair protein)
MRLSMASVARNAECIGLPRSDPSAAPMPRPLTRSEIMARVHRRDTGPERSIRSALHAAGLRFRVDCRIEGVHADIVHGPSRVLIFIDGCFWHGCPRHGSQPKTNRAYWLPKLAANRDRDRRQTKLLRRAGWRVVRLWEHQCQTPTPQVVARVMTIVRHRRAHLGATPGGASTSRQSRR